MIQNVISKIALIGLLVFLIWLGVNSPYKWEGRVCNYRQETFRYKIDVCAGTRLPLGLCFDGISYVYYDNEINLGRPGMVEYSYEKGLSEITVEDSKEACLAITPVEKVGWLWGRPLVLDSCPEGSCLLQIPLDWVEVEEGSFIVHLWER
jgi:hypothetical protein